MTDILRFTGDRYQRLAEGAAVLATDPAVRDAPLPFNGNGLHVFVNTIGARRMLDDLDERDADLVSLWLLLDFYLGPRRMAWRLHDWLSGGESSYQRSDNIWAVASVFAGAMNVMIDALAAVDRFENGESVVQPKPSRYRR